MSIYLSIVIPAYNEAPVLDQFLPSLYCALAELPDQQEIVIVDDGSRDNLREVFQAHLAACPAHIALRLVQLSRNFGKEGADCGDDGCGWATSDFGAARDVGAQSARNRYGGRCAGQSLA